LPAGQRMQAPWDSRPLHKGVAGPVECHASTDRVMNVASLNKCAAGRLVGERATALFSVKFQQTHRPLHRI